MLVLLVFLYFENRQCDGHSLIMYYVLTEFIITQFTLI